MKLTNWKTIGHIAVDAGLCWIGDPCYVLHQDKKPQEIGQSWEEFCNLVIGKTTQFDNELGVCVSTGYGDGSYPVQVKFTTEGRVAEVRVVFIDNEEGKND